MQLAVEGGFPRSLSLSPAARAPPGSRDFASINAAHAFICLSTAPALFSRGRRAVWGFLFGLVLGEYYLLCVRGGFSRVVCFFFPYSRNADSPFVGAELWRCCVFSCDNGSVGDSCFWCTGVSWK